jgi:hypothetical protein
VATLAALFVPLNWDIWRLWGYVTHRGHFRRDFVAGKCRRAADITL